MNSQKPMSEEEIKKIANDIFNESIMNNLDSSIIFKYIQGLEKENQKYKETIEKTIKYIEYDMPYLQEVDNEYEDVNGNIYLTYKEYDGKKLLDILNEVE